MGIALASITKDLGQFVTWLILGFASQAIVTILLTDHVRGFAVSQSWDTPFVFLAQAVVMAATAGIVCWLQYSSRATGRSRCVCIGGLLAMALLPFVLPLGAINEYLVRFSAPVADSVARLSLDSPRELSSIPNWSWDPRHRYYHLPIDVAGIPWGMHAASEYVAVTLTAPNGETWSSGWNAPNEIHSGQATGEGRVLRGDGKYWLYMEVPHSFNDRFVSVPVHLRARATFTLLGVPQIARVRTDGQSQRLPGGRFCGNEWRDRFLSATCLAPFRKPAEATLRFRFPDTGKMEEHGSSGDGLMVNSVWTVIASASEQVKGPVNVTLETREVVGRFERVLDAAGVRLSEYMQ